MKEANASATFTIKRNEFNNSGCGWAPIRIRTAGYTTGNTIEVNITDNQFIESAYNENGIPQFLENPSYTTGDGEFDKIYTVGRNYYEWNGEVYTELTDENFTNAAKSYEAAYNSKDELNAEPVETFAGSVLFDDVANI